MPIATKFEIKNFRSFSDLKFGPLTRVNLISGKNNVGKSSLLEAILLMNSANRPDMPGILNQSRGIPYSVDPVEYWGWLFLNKDLSNEIELNSWYDHDSDDFDSFAIKIVKAKSMTTNGQAQKRENGRDILARNPIMNLEQTLRRSNGLIEQNTVQLLTNGVHSDLNIEFNRPSYFNSGRTSISPDLVNSYSILEIDGRIQSVVEDLRKIEPRLLRLSLVTVAEEPVIHGDIGLGKLIPLQLMGEGVLKLTTILLSLRTLSKGTALLDDIESGFHYSVLDSVWGAIHRAAVESDVQVFATTHSSECVWSAHRVFDAENPTDFSYFRLGQGRNGLQAFQFDSDMINVAFQTNVEIR